MLIYGLILGIYTGILLSAFNARPLWNTSILGPLFLASGLSAGAAATLIMSKDKAERKQFARIDLVIIGIELFLNSPYVHGISCKHPGSDRGS